MTGNRYRSLRCGSTNPAVFIDHFSRERGCFAHSRGTFAALWGACFSALAIGVHRLAAPQAGPCFHESILAHVTLIPHE